jgi:hypothetical protein
MRYLKAFAIAVLAGAALIAVVGASPAAAETILCTKEATPCPAGKSDGGVGNEVKMSLASGTKSVIDARYKNISCSKSLITAKVTSAGEADTAGVEGLSFEECNCEVKVLAKGTLELSRIASTANATVRSTGTEVTTVCTVLGLPVHCVYVTSNTHLGTLDGGNPAKLPIVGAHLPVDENRSDGVCPEESNWTATYEVTSPKPLYVEPEALLFFKTILCTDEATPCPAGKSDGRVGDEIKMSLASGTKSVIDTRYKNISCSKSSLTAKVTSSGEADTAGGEALNFEECNCEVKVLAKGTLNLEYISSTANATVTSTGTEVTTVCTVLSLPVHCVYVTGNTDLGTLDGGNPAKLTIAGTHLPVDEKQSDNVCPEESNWTATYEVTSPKPLYVEPEAEDGTILCTEKAPECPAGKSDGVGTEVKASLVSGSKSKLTTPYNNIECGKSSITAKVTSAGKAVGSSVEGLTFEECNCEVKVLAKGTLELARIAASDNATVTSTGTEVTTVCATISGNVHCIYKTEATDFGTLEGGNPAKIKVSGVNIPRLATDTRCNEGEGAKWDVEYEVTSPKPLYIEPQ